MLENSEYALRNRQTTARNRQLYEDFGPYFNTIIIRILRLEVVAVGKDSRMHLKPQDVSPQLCEEFSLQDYEKLYLEKAPIFFNLLRLLCCVDDAMEPLRTQDIGEPLVPEELEEEMEDNDNVENDLSDTDGLDAIASESGTENEVNPKILEAPTRCSRKARSKPMMSVMAMSIIIASRSQRNNGITGRMGIFMRAMKVPKRMHSFLAACGLCNAYDTSSIWLRENAASDRVVLANKFQAVPMAICWDNLVRFDRTVEETVLNQGSKIQQNTSALVFPLHLSPPPENASDTEFETYGNVNRASCTGQGVGLPRALLFHDVNYESLLVDPAEFLEVDMLKSHIPKIAGELVAEVLATLCGDALLEYQVDGSRVRWNCSFAEYLQLDLYRPNFHTCPTMPVDETTIDGTGLVIDTLLEYSGTSAGQLTDGNRVILCYGDQLTNKNLTALKEMRIREAESDRFSFTVAKPGFLHTSMAMVNAVTRCNWGHTTGGRNPGCLSRFAAILGRLRANETASDFQASYRLIDHVLRGHVAAALMTQASLLSGKEPIATLSDLKSWVKVNDWRKLIDCVILYYFGFGKVAWQRKMALEKVSAQYELLRNTIMSKKKVERSQAEIKFTQESGKIAFVRQHTEAERDKVLENAILFMTQALVAVDFQQSMRKGHVGRLEVDMKIMMLCFHGCGKTKYAQLLLERAFDQRYIWTQEHHYIDIRNNVICTGRRFTGIDECLEHVNRDISDSYNPRDTWQSQEFHRNVVSPNVVPYRKMKHSVFGWSGISTGGNRHSSPKAMNDILLVMDALLREKVLAPEAGRRSVGPDGGKVGVQETVDMFDIGSEKVMHGGVVEALLTSRRRRSVAPYVPELDHSEWAAEMEEAVKDWNLEVEALQDVGSGDLNIEMDIDD
jgi:hypothetical protein